MLLCAKVNQTTVSIHIEDVFGLVSSSVYKQICKFAYFKYSNFQSRNLILELEFVSCFFVSYSLLLTSYFLAASLESYKIDSNHSICR